LKINTPIVKIYHSNGAEFMVGGVNIGQLGLINFSYEYSEDKADKGKITLRFNHGIPLRLRSISPGTYLKLRWGYIGKLSNFRSIAVEGLSTAYDDSGFTLNIKYVSAADYVLDTEPASMKDLMDRGITVSYTYEDKAGLTQTIIINQKKDGTQTTSSVVNQVVLTPQAFPKPEGEDWDAGYTDPNQGFYAAAPPGSARAGRAALNSSGIIEGESIRDITTETMRDKLQLMLAEYLKTAFDNNSKLQTRDGNIAISPSGLTQPPSFGIRVGNHLTKKNSLGLISISIGESSGAVKGIGFNGRLFNPLVKREHNIYSYITDGTVPATVYAYTVDGKLLTKVRIGSEEEANIGNWEQGEAEVLGTLVVTPEGLALRTASGKEKLLSSKEAEKYEQQIVQIKEAQDYKQKQDLLRLAPGPGFQRDADGNLYYNRHDEYYRANPNTAIPVPNVDQDDVMLDIAENEGFNTENLDYVTRREVGAFGSREAFNRAANSALESYFNKTKAKVVLEGIPSIEVGFSFNIYGLADLHSGRYYCKKTTHTIQAGRYVTSLEAFKIPTAFSGRKAGSAIDPEKATAWVDYDKIEAAAVDALNENFNVPELQLVREENRIITDGYSIPMTEENFDIQNKVEPIGPSNYINADGDYIKDKNE